MTRHRGHRRRIVLGMIEVSGYWSRMHDGLVEIGEDVTLLCLEPHPYAYQDKPAPAAVRLVQRLRTGNRSVWHRAAEALLRCVLFVQFVPTHDIFVFGYRTSFFNTRDLWLLKRLGKTIVMVFHGSDERPPYMDGYLGTVPDAELAPRTRRQKLLLDRCRRYADLIVSNPNSGQLQTGTCLTYHVLGNPVSTTIPTTPSAPGSVEDRTIKILHAPSNPEAKGSALIREICLELQASGLAVELDEVTDVPNAELHRRVLDADIVVDQSYGDCPWAMFAAEASLLGRPVVVGGYGHDHLRRFLPDGFVPPAAYCEPELLGSAIAELATDERKRVQLGMDARTFATEMWAPATVAARLVAALEGDAPDEWYFDASQIDYPWGGGISRDQVRRRVRAMLRSDGAASLCIDDKPALLTRLVEESA